MSISENPAFTALADRIVRTFEGSVDEDLDGLIEDDTLETLEERGIELRGAVEAAIDDAYFWGAAALGGLIGMAAAIQERMPYQHPGELAVFVALRKAAGDPTYLDQPKPEQVHRDSDDVVRGSPAPKVFPDSIRDIE